MLDKITMENNVKKIRADFPIYDNNPNLIYLDSGATSLKPKCGLNKMNEYYTNYGVNIHRGVYHLSYKATLEYDKARENVASFINAKDKEIIFTKNTSDSLNMLCLMYSKMLSKGDEIISSYLEHHSSILPWMVSAKENGFKIKFAELNKNGRLSINAIKDKISVKTKVIVVTYISNVLGYINDIKEIVRIAHEKGIIVIVDAAQAIQHVKIDVQDLDCDFLAFSGHKMFGPTGVGVLYGKKKLLKMLKPLYYGGDMNENVSVDDIEIKEIPYCFETGTPMIAEVLGLSVAIDYIKQIGFDYIKEHDDSIKEYLEEKIHELNDIIIYNDHLDTPILSFNIKGVHPHDVASFLDQENICVRAGHHCAQLLTRFLKCNGTLRASFQIYNDYNDVDHLIESLKKIIKFFKESYGESNE